MEAMGTASCIWHHAFSDCPQWHWKDELIPSSDRYWCNNVWNGALNWKLDSFELVHTLPLRIESNVTINSLQVDRTQLSTDRSGVQ